MTAPTVLLDADEIKLISALLLAAETGPFFPEWEFSTLFGLERSELAAVRSRWPDVSLEDEDVYQSVLSSLALLIAYPHGHEEALLRYCPEGRLKIKHLYDKCASLEIGSGKR
jgi:hypothetical protein